MSNTGRLVCVSGQIGAGKSTLVHALATELGFEALPEREADNPYLKRYYEDPGAWAFKSFLFFLEQSLGDYLHARRDSRGAVQERPPHEHLEVFGREFHAQGYLTDDDLALFERLTRTTMGDVAAPELLVHLEVSAETALARMGQRAREAERGVSLEYLRKLELRYVEFVETWDLCPVLRIDTDRIDLRTPTAVRSVGEEAIEILSPEDEPA